MDTTWQVTHTFNVPMLFAGGPTMYPKLGATLIIKEEKIVAVEHRFALQNADSTTDAIELSKWVLRPLWEHVEYQSSYPASKSRSTAEKVSDGGGIRSTVVNHTANSFLVHPVTTPPEQVLIEASRLHAWIRLALDAQNLPSDINAIRNYWLIWEDMHNEKPVPNSPAEKLRCTRHFVSHPIINDKKVLAFLEHEIGAGTKQYNPHNPDHVQFLRIRRDEARSLMAAEIKRHF